MNYSALAAELNDVIPFNHLLGITVEAIGPGYASVRLPDKGKLHNRVGTQAAGGLFTAGEAASGAAFLGAFGDHLTAVTSLNQGATIQYRKLAVGEILATGRVDDPDGLLERMRTEGAVQFPVAVELRDEGGEIVATMAVEWYVTQRVARVAGE